MSAKELLAREFYGGSNVINCVTHMGLDITRRPDDCALCLTDLRNAFSRAVVINEWLNEWKSDATAILAALPEEGEPS
jgi:hypothetical protein